MNRSKNISRIKSEKLWDIIIIGGGASGLGSAIESASRGYKTLLVERFDFAKGTSSRSTKLVHGGVRYLQNGDISLVVEALKERGLLRKNAPHLVKDLSSECISTKWFIFINDKKTLAIKLLVIIKSTFSFLTYLETFSPNKTLKKKFFVL